MAATIASSKITAAISNAFLLFVARMGAGLGQSYYIPVAGPMLMDGYPIGARAKIFAANGSFQMAGQALGPLMAPRTPAGPRA